MISLLSVENVFTRRMVMLTDANSRSAVERNILPMFWLPFLPALRHKFFCLWSQVVSAMHKKSGVADGCILENSDRIKALRTTTTGKCSIF